MSMTLQELMDRVEADVAAVDGVPSADQYSRAVQEAVRDFSRRCGLKKRSTLDITPGTATYALEADFLKLIKLAALVAHQGVMITTEGIIPVPSWFKETWTIGGGQITFYPTPRYKLTRAYEYKAGWVLTTDDYLGEVYETMGEEEADVVLLKARALALAVAGMSSSASGSGFKYQIGDVMIDKSGGSRQQTNVSSGEDLEKAYLAACESYNGNTGRMG